MGILLVKRWVGGAAPGSSAWWWPPLSIHHSFNADATVAIGVKLQGQVSTLDACLLLKGCSKRKRRDFHNLSNLCILFHAIVARVRISRIFSGCTRMDWTMRRRRGKRRRRKGGVAGGRRERWLSDTRASHGWLCLYYPPTDPFAIPGPQNSSIDVSKLHKVFQLTFFWKGRSGQPVIPRVCDS